jgi:two-component system sensor histidine kinase BaeS
MRTLRGRLVLSHLLPMLVVVPAIGIVLIYLLQTQMLLVGLSEEMTQQALLIAELANSQEDIWLDSARAQSFVTRLDLILEARVMIIDPQGCLLASSDPTDASFLGQWISVPGMDEIESTGVEVHTGYNRDLRPQNVDVLVPVRGSNQQFVGAIRLTQQLSSLYQRFANLRYAIVGILLAAVVLGGVLGWLLALNLSRRLSHLTESIRGLTTAGQPAPLPEQGPEEIRLLLQAYNSLIERLRSAEEARRRLLANVVHEVGRPLGALLSAIEALLHGGAEDPAFRQELLEGMEAEVLRSQRLLDDLAQLRDRLSDKLELTLRPTALSAWLNQVLSPWREAAQEKQLAWQISIPADLPTVNVDADRLGQALGNLLSNAIRYTPAGGKVSVLADVDSETVWIEVRDTGQGINPSEQDHIFEPFYRAQSGRRFPQGMGLGLTIARDLVEAHGGQLKMESTAGEGSSFTIWLPL